MKDLLSEIKELENDMILDRRALHRHPEVSGSEYWTTGYIKDKLNGFNVPIEKLKLDVGVSALIKGSRPGKTICIRHDIDALRIQEKTNLSFSSEIEGISHACGHDIHTVIALYCAKLLNERRKEIEGNVRIVFQPAEETAEGAKMMINAGIMDLEPKNDIVIGVHTYPATMAGKISVIDLTSVRVYYRRILFKEYFSSLEISDILLQSAQVHQPRPTEICGEEIWI